jgi:hypothetical protein
MGQLGSHWTEYHKIRYMQIFRKSILKIQVLLKSEKNNGYLHKNLCKFMIIFLLILVTMRNVSDKVCRENQNTYSMFSNFFSENYEIMWKNVVEKDRPQITI